MNVPRPGARLAWLVAALAVAAVPLAAGLAAVAARGEGTEVRVAARRLSDGRVEFALQERADEGWSERVLPSRRFFPADGRGRWLHSSPVVVGVEDEPTVVARVVDGDTIEVRLPGGELERVRLLLVDTPEVHGGAECYGREASERVRALLPEGAEVILERDATNRDSFGRLLRYVRLPDGSMLNERLAAEGYARYLPYDRRNVLHAERIEAAQERARSAGLGLWGACPAGAGEAPPPEASPAPPPSVGAPDGECDPAYVNLCLPPPPPDLNCADVDPRLREAGLDALELREAGVDPHGLDRDRDGLACEIEG